MLENAGLQAPLFAKRADGRDHKNQRGDDKQNDHRSEDVLCLPIDRQKGGEGLARDRPCKRKRERLNEDRNDGTRIRPSDFVARWLCDEEENRSENNETHDDKAQRPKLKPAWHCWLSAITQIGADFNRAEDLSPRNTSKTRKVKRGAVGAQNLGTRQPLSLVDRPSLWAQIPGFFRSA